MIPFATSAFGSASRDPASESGILIFRRAGLLWSIRPELFGIPNDLPLTYDLFLSLLEPQDRERTDQAVKRSVETGCSFDMQYRVDGQSRPRQWIRAAWQRRQRTSQGTRPSQRNRDRHRRSEAGRRSVENAGGSPAIHPGDNSGCDDCHRRPRHHAVL